MLWSLLQLRRIGIGPCPHPSRTLSFAPRGCRPVGWERGRLPSTGKGTGGPVQSLDCQVIDRRGRAYPGGRGFLFRSQGNPWTGRIAGRLHASGQVLTASPSVRQSVSSGARSPFVIGWGRLGPWRRRRTLLSPWVFRVWSGQYRSRGVFPTRGQGCPVDRARTSGHRQHHRPAVRLA